jgi:uncharacterized membrane protein
LRDYASQLGIVWRAKSLLVLKTHLQIVRFDMLINTLFDHEKTKNCELGWFKVALILIFVVVSLVASLLVISVTQQAPIYSNVDHSIGKDWESGTTVTAASRTNSTLSASAILSAQSATLGVNLSISPVLQTGFDGNTLRYTVTVSNTGDVSDTYSLVCTDNSGWANKYVLPTSLPVSAGSSESATLFVTIPYNALVGTLDNITVTASSQTDNTVSGSRNCTAQAIADVTVFISPGSQIGRDNATLAYDVTIINISSAEDTFSISVSDNSRWTLNVSPTSFVLKAKYSNVCVLSVTIPADTVGGASDNITVTATSQTDNFMSVSESCTAQAAMLGVALSVSPSSKTGANGTTLNYDVTVNNTGNVDDNYSLSIRDNASLGWSPRVSSTTLSVPAGESESVKLSVDIPSNAAAGTIDEITIIVNSQADNTVSASEDCMATAKAVSGISESIYVVAVIVIVLIIGLILMIKRAR